MRLVEGLLDAGIQQFMLESRDHFYSGFVMDRLKQRQKVLLDYLFEVKTDQFNLLDQTLLSYLDWSMFRHLQDEKSLNAYLPWMTQQRGRESVSTTAPVLI